MGRSTFAGPWGAGFASVVDAWSDTLGSPATRAAYLSDLSAFGRWCVEHGSIPLRADTSVVAAYLLEQEIAGHRPATVRRRRSSLSSFYRYAVGVEVTDTNPVTGTARPRSEVDEVSSTPVLSPRDVEGYLAVAASLGPRVEALVALIVFDGLKLGEALAADVDDVRGRPPKVSLTVRRKGAACRLELDPRSGRAVRRCAEGRAGQPLFTSARPASADRGHRRLTRFGADHLIKQLASVAEAPVSASALRRFHVVSRHASGADLEAVRERAGLTDVRTVLRHLPPGARALTG